MEPREQVVIGLDLGGTKLLGILLGADGTVRHSLQVPTTPGGNDAIVGVVLSTLGRLQSAAQALKAEVGGIAIGAPGYVDEAQGVVLDASNIAVRDLPLADIVQAHYRLPTLILHDVKAATQGEASYGAGASLQHFAYLNVGTGISVGLYLDGRVYQGAAGRAGELGHVTVQTEGPMCVCGRRGCLEALASGWALGRQAAKRAALKPSSLLAQLADEAAGKANPPSVTADSGSVSGAVIAAAARGGDPDALVLLGAAAGHLGKAVAGLVNVLDLQRVIIGGGVAQMGDLILAPLRSNMARHLLPEYRDTVEALPSPLNTNTGAIGAATTLQLRLATRTEVR